MRAVRVIPRAAASRRARSSRAWSRRTVVLICRNIHYNMSVCQTGLLPRSIDFDRATCFIVRGSLLHPFICDVTARASGGGSDLLLLGLLLLGRSAVRHACSRRNAASILPGQPPRSVRGSASGRARATA
jgi:hypothetical protein